MRAFAGIRRPVPGSSAGAGFDGGWRLPDYSHGGWRIVARWCNSIGKEVTLAGGPPAPPKMSSGAFAVVGQTVRQIRPRYHYFVEQFALEFDLVPKRRIFTVSELNAAIRTILDEEFRDVWVSGEISGIKLAASGHYYFTLKERDSQVKCVAFRSAHRYWKFKPLDGLAVLARGRIDVYEVRGEYQLQVEMLEPQGLGALQLAFEQLKKKLAAEGLFSTERKRPLPRFPRRIGIVTSPRGAAIADMV